MRLPILLILLVFPATLACDSDGGSAGIRSGTLTLAAEQGVDFREGSVIAPGNFANSDLYATRNGTALKLATGGPSPVTNHPVNWFMGPSGLHQTFTSLDEVPTETPTEGMTDSLVRARTGNGFVLRTRSGAWVRGWIASADEASVTISYGPLPAAN